MGGIKCDVEMYKWRCLFENLFCNPKRLRRIALRDAAVVRYEGIVQPVGSFN